VEPNIGKSEISGGIINEDQDRFHEHALGVKMHYRPDWLDSENKLFINKLNFAAKHYSETHATVKNLKTTCLKDHKLLLDELDIN